MSEQSAAQLLQRPPRKRESVCVCEKRRRTKRNLEESRRDHFWKTYYNESLYLAEEHGSLAFFIPRGTLADFMNGSKSCWFRVAGP